MLDGQPLGEYPELESGIFFHPWLILGVDNKLRWLWPRNQSV